MQISRPMLQRPAVAFGAKFETNTDKLSALRDELESKFPASAQTNGSGIGFMSYPDDKRIGIKIYTQEEVDKQMLISDLLARNIIKPEPKGAFQYKNALVGFETIGRIVAQ